MKLRCQHNSIRLRLRRSEIELLQKTNQVTEEILLPAHQVFTYQITITESESWAVNFENQKLIISIPGHQARKWLSTSLVGLYSHITVDDHATTLELIIEKDFHCIGREDDDKKDFFSELSSRDEDLC